MNWYFLTKIAQLWTHSESDSFEDELIHFHEMEYKLSMLHQRPFNGMPKRKENIMAKLQEALYNSIEKVKEPLIKTFEGWLQSHALTNPSGWAAEMIKPPGGGTWEDYGDDEAEARIRNLVFDYENALSNIQGGAAARLKPSGYGQETSVLQQLQKIISDNMNIVVTLPSFQQLINLFVEDYREMEQQNAGVQI